MYTVLRCLLTGQFRVTVTLLRIGCTVHNFTYIMFSKVLILILGAHDYKQACITQPLEISVYMEEYVGCKLKYCFYLIYLPHSLRVNFVQVQVPG